MAPDATAGSPEAASPAAAPARKAVKAPGAAADGPKLTALMLAIKRIEQMYGKGSLMRFGDRGQQLPKVEIISSGSMSLDHALGTGGLPRGRIVEMYGPESSGKTTVALHVVAEAQRQGGTCVFIDAEHALDPGYARRIGVNVDDLYISQPDNGEQALDIADTLIKSGAADCVVIDSVAALVPRAELEGDMGDHHIALQARLMSQALRKLTATIARTNSLLIFINQTRQKVGVIFGSNEVTTGGTALRFYSSVRLEIRKGTQLRHDGETFGHRIKVKVVKNKLAPPFGQAEFDMLFGTGIDRRGEVLDLGVKVGLVGKSGSWFSLKETEALKDAFDEWPVLMGQGRDKAKVFLEQHPHMFDALQAAVREELQHTEVHHDLSDPLLPAVEAEGQEGAAAAADEPTRASAAAGVEVGALEGAEAPVLTEVEAVVEPPSGVGELDIGVDYMTGEVQNMGAYVMAKERAAEAREQA